MVVWTAFATLVEARKGATRQEHPAVIAVVEAELVHRYCPDSYNDVEQVRQRAAERGMNCADFFSYRRSPAFQQRLTTLHRQLRRDPRAACDRLWSDHGSKGQEIHLLRRG